MTEAAAQCLAILEERGKEAGLSFTPEQLEQFGIYYDMLVETNKVMNLTALTSPEDVAVKHFIDCLTACDPDRFSGKTLIDVGTGAGFPGIPLKIYCPDLKVVLLDSLAKRLRFLEDVIERLGLTDIRCEHLRAEEGGRNKAFRGKYDIVTARAVARLSVLAEYCLPFARKGGMFIALKGSRYQEEIQEAEKALAILGGRIVKVEPAKLPGLDDGRALVWIRKVRDTPGAYPRKAGTPNKNPLGS
mgnify:CR=1 FL=1